MNIFNNREIAIGIWLLIAIIFIASKQAVRASFSNVLKAFFDKHIFIPILLMVGYISLVVIGLQRLGLWDIGQFKNTIIWGLSYAVTSMFRISNIENEEHYFRNSVKDQLKIIAAFEFIVTFYTYSLLTELIIIPLVTSVIAMQAIAQGKKEHATAERFLSGMLTLFGVSLVINAIYHLVNEFDGFTKLGTLQDFGIPIVLSILLVPFLFGLAIYSSYEIAFIRIGSSIKEPSLSSYAKRKSVFEFNIHINLLKRWLRNIANKTPTDKLKLQSSINQVKSLASREKTPAVIASTDGWSPYQARKFLTSKNLTPSDYHQDAFDESEWFSSTSHIEIGTGIFPNNVAYYIEGDELIARKLKLVVNYNDIESETETTVQFTEIASELFRNAMAQEMPDILVEKIMSKSPVKIDVFGKFIAIEIDNWSTGLGFSIKLTMQNAQDELAVM